VAPLPSNDDRLLDAIADFAGMPRGDLLAILAALINRGVVIERGDQMRVAPDVLADEVLGAAAVGRGRDSGYIPEVWAALGEQAGHRLVVNLAELAWRLAASGQPDLFSGVWHAVEAEVEEGSLERVDAAVHVLAPLAHTQPSRLFELLSGILKRLPDLEHAAGEAAKDLPDVREGQPEPAQMLDAASGLRPTPLMAESVAQRIAPLLARCALAEPELLPRALDALWGLAAHDTREIHRFPEHPARLICEELADLDKASGPGTFEVVLERVEAWLAKPDPVDAARTALFALEPLLGKSGIRHNWRRDALVMSPYLVAPEKVAELRERSRALLIREGCGGAVRRAVDAVRILGVGLRQPSAYFGRTMLKDNILAWESEDLATLTAMREIAKNTTEPLVRRLIRHELEWDATRAASLAVRTAALSLVTELDETSRTI
jgi:hypothetical protein